MPYPTETCTISPWWAQLYGLVVKMTRLLVWRIPFLTPSWTKVGFQGLFFGRIDYQERGVFSVCFRWRYNLRPKKTMHFLIVGPPKNYSWNQHQVNITEFYSWTIWMLRLSYLPRTMAFQRQDQWRGKPSMCFLVPGVLLEGQADSGWRFLVKGTSYNFPPDKGADGCLYRSPMAETVLQRNCRDVSVDTTIILSSQVPQTCLFFLRNWSGHDDFDIFWLCFFMFFLYSPPKKIITSSHLTKTSYWNKKGKQNPTI